MIERTQALDYLAQEKRKAKKAKQVSQKQGDAKPVASKKTAWDKQVEATFPASDAIAKY